MPKEMRRPPPNSSDVELTPLQKEVARAIARELEQIWNATQQAVTTETQDKAPTEVSAPAHCTATCELLDERQRASHQNSLPHERSR